MAKVTFSIVESITLKEKLKQLTADKNKYALKELYKKFAVFIGEHQDAKQMHGNLTDENILINSYGGIYVQTGETDAYSNSLPVVYNKNFAHPDYIDFQHSVGADDFSLLTIATSIFAYTLEPQLFQSLHSEKILLFSKRDFENYNTSRVFDYLQSLNNSLLNILLSQIKIALVNKNPKVANLASLLLLDEKYHISIQCLKEKEFLQTYIEYKEEYIEVLQDKYVEQIRCNTSNEVETDMQKDSKKELEHLYFNLKSNNRNFIRAFYILLVLVTGYFFTNSVSGKNKNTTNEFANDITINNNNEVVLAENNTILSPENNEKVENRTDLIVAKNKIVAKPANTTTATAVLYSNVQSNLKKQNTDEKTTKSTAATVTFKEIDFGK